MNKQIIKSILIVLLIIGVTQLIGYWEIQYYDDKFKHEGIDVFGSLLAFMFVLGASFYCSKAFVFPKEWKEKDGGCLTELACFIFSMVLAFTLTIHVRNKLDETVAEALNDSYTTIGHITRKNSHTYRGYTTYDIWVGINDTTTSRHSVDKNRYEMSYVGAPVIIKVSKQNPCINEVIIWTPLPADIDKYEKKP